MMRKLTNALVFLGILCSVAMVPAGTAAAAGGCDSRFLTFPTWYRGLTNGDCTIKAPSSAGGISNFIWAIALNVLEILLQAVAYLATAYIIWGGYLYITSTGSSDGITRARKMILNAVIGLVLSLFAVVAVSFIVGRIT